MKSRGIISRDIASIFLAKLNLLPSQAFSAHGGTYYKKYRGINPPRGEISCRWWDIQQEAS